MSTEEHKVDKIYLTHPVGRGPQHASSSNAKFRMSSALARGRRQLLVARAAHSRCLRKLDSVDDLLSQAGEGMRWLCDELLHDHAALDTANDVAAGLVRQSSRPYLCEIDSQSENRIRWTLHELTEPISLVGRGRGRGISAIYVTDLLSAALLVQGHYEDASSKDTWHAALVLTDKHVRQLVSLNPAVVVDSNVYRTAGGPKKEDLQ